MTTIGALFEAHMAGILVIVAAVGVLSLAAWSVSRARRTRATRLESLRNQVQRLRRLSISKLPLDRRRIPGLVGTLRRKCEQWNVPLHLASTSDRELDRFLAAAKDALHASAAATERTLPLRYPHEIAMPKPRPVAAAGRVLVPEPSPRARLAPLAEVVENDEWTADLELPKATAVLEDPLVRNMRERIVVATNARPEDDIIIEVDDSGDDEDDILIIDPSDEDVEVVADDGEGFPGLDEAFREYEARPAAADLSAEDADLARKVERWFDEIITENAETAVSS